MRRVAVGCLLSMGSCTFGSGGNGSSAGLGETTDDATTATATATTTGTPSPASTSEGAEGTSSGGADVDPSTSSTGGPEPTDTDAGSTGAPPGCNVANGGCDLNATCDDGSGRVTCTCNVGWQGDGTTCASSGVLSTLRVEVPCNGEQTGCTNAGGFCITGSSFEEDSAVMEGDPGVTYNVTLELRGALSEATILGGMPDGLWNDGGTPVAGDLWSAVALTVSEPGQSYYVNAGLSGHGYCTIIDYPRIVPVTTGATVTITYADLNMCAALNEDVSGVPIVFPGIDNGMAYDGQFLQVDMASSVPQQ